MVAVAGLWPDNQVVLTSGCEPEGKLSSFRSSVQGRLFWRRQLRQIDDEMAWIAWIKGQPKARARVRAVVEKMDRDSQAMLEDFYAKHPDLRQHESESERAASALREQAESIREQAEAIEEAEFQRTVLAPWLARRLGQLQRCRPVAQAKAR
jgi:hypothetical protein